MSRDGVGDSAYTAEQLLDPRIGDRFYLDDGDIRIDCRSTEHVDFVRWRKDEAGSGKPVRMAHDVWREAVKRYLTRHDQPTMTCPKCKAEIEDFDGVGVLAHLECGYCTHPSTLGGVCGICSKAVSHDTEAK